MATLKTSQASPPEDVDRIPDEFLDAVKEGRFCKPCRKAFKNVPAFQAHVRTDRRHSAPAPVTNAAAGQPAPGLRPGEVVFHSPKAPEQRVVIPNHAAMWSRTETPGGTSTQTKKGLQAQFKGGILKTANKKIIAYLTGDLEACRELKILDEDGEPIVYEDARHPVFTQQSLRDMALTY